MTNKTLGDQIQGASRLIITGTLGVTHVVEDAHIAIASGPRLLGKPFNSIAKAFLSPIYSMIRNVMQNVGLAVDQVLDHIVPLLDQPAAEKGKLLAIINGVIGDYLEDTQNPLATQMQFCTKKGPILMKKDTLLKEFPSGQRLLIAIHGSCLEESCWWQITHSHTEHLARDHEWSQVYVRYNSGRHISKNGLQLAELLENLTAAWPHPISEILLLGHSMGGLVARSACLQAEHRNFKWRRSLKAMIMLGSPHHGAPLERAGNWIDTILSTHHFSAPFALLGQIRSAGVTDLRYGSILESDWQGKNRFTFSKDARQFVPLPKDVECFAVAGTTKKTPHGKLPSDGIVPVASALGQHKDPSKKLNFKESHLMIAYGTGHLELLRSHEVYKKILSWINSLP